MERIIILDADIASAFAKIAYLDQIKNLLSKYKIVITPRIREELLVSLQFGYSFPQDIFEHFEVLYPSEEESHDYLSLLSLKGSFGKGEAEVISICRNRHCIFSSLDRVALKAARDLVPKDKIGPEKKIPW